MTPEVKLIFTVYKLYIYLYITRIFNMFARTEIWKLVRVDVSQGRGGVVYSNICAASMCTNIIVVMFN